MATCPRPMCNGAVINSKCVKCGAFTYVPTGTQNRQPLKPGNPGQMQGTGVYVPPPIMKLHQWKHLTNLKLKRRSGLLRQLDRAIKEYETNKGPMKLGKLRLCFDAWVNQKGGLKGAWMTSPNDRNCRNALTTLAKQINGERVALARDFMGADMDNARLGIVYFFSKLELEYNDFKFLLQAPAELIGKVSSFGVLNKDLGVNKSISGIADAVDQGIGLGTDIFKTGTVLSTDLTASSLQKMQEANTPHGVKLRQIIQEFITGIWNSLKETFKISWENAANWTNLVVNATKSIALICTSILAKTVAPFIGGAVDIIGGVAKIFKGVRTLIVDKWKGRHSTMLPGHPTTIYTSLRLHMSRSIFEGFYEVIKGSLNMAVDAVSAALGAASFGTATAVIGIAKSIAGLVLTILELIAKFMYRLIEGIFIKKFIGKAKEHWNSRDDQISIHRDHERFNEWYRRSAIIIPAIAALTINGGICGDSMRFLQVVRDDGGIVTQSQFTAGCKHLDSLKDYGKNLISDCGWRFHSQDAMVQGALTRAGEKKAMTAGGALLSVVDNLFGA